MSFKGIWEILYSNYLLFCSNLSMKFAIFLKSSLLFNSFYCLFLFINKNLRLDNLKTAAAMNAKMSVFFVCVEVIIYLLLYNLHDCTFNSYTYHQCSSLQKQPPEVFYKKSCSKIFSQYLQKNTCVEVSFK